MKSISILRLTAILLCSMHLLGSASLQAQMNKWVNYSPDLTTVLKNPAMGWMMYEEGWSFQGTRHNKSNIYTPEVFWKQMEECKAADYSNILYIRMLWKDLEPEEGKYAWIYNERYKWYIQKAKDKGLKLAFRVFFHGVDGVPSYVYEAGATESPIDDEGKTQPYYDNPVFLEKLDKFIEAFAKEYDNPDEVDYIDAYGLGRWGEGHGLVLEKQDNLESVIRQITESYARHFKKVLTVMNLSQSDYRFSKPLVYDKLGFLPRRDGIGSFWFSNEERAMVHDELFPKRALIGEGCWWMRPGDRRRDARHLRPRGGAGRPVRRPWGDGDAHPGSMRPGDCPGGLRPAHGPVHLRGLPCHEQEEPPPPSGVPAGRGADHDLL